MKVASEGLVIGANENSVWLIPWWYKYFSRHNNYDVLLVDFGLSESSRKKCEKLFSVEPLKVGKDFVKAKTEISSSLIGKWEDLYGENVWKARNAWFLKPFALLQSPFEKTIWLDLDCEVCCNLKPVFDLLDEGTEFSVAFDPQRLHTYNSGVIAYKKETKLIERWANSCLKHNHEFVSDDEVLSQVIGANEKGFKVLPEIFHHVPNELTDDAVIIHWMASWGKQFIELFGGYQGYKDYLLSQ